MGLYLVYEQIINYYKEKISNGELVVGDELESETATAELFEVSRGTVRKALKYLKENGIIITKRGKKSCISENAKQLLDGLDISLTHKRICLMFINNGEYLEPIISLLKERIRHLGWVCDVMFNHDENAERKCIDAIIEKNYDGVICTPYRENDNFAIRNYLRLQKAGIPFVLVGQTSEKLFCDSVSNNDFMASYRVTNALIKEKCQKLIHVTDTRMDKIVRSDREKGYLEGIKFSKKEPIILDCKDSRFEEKLMAVLKEDKFQKIGFNVYSDIQVEHILPSIESLGLKANKDYKIICFRERYLKQTDNRFKTVSVSRREIGHSALKILKDKLEGDCGNSHVTHIIFNVDLRADYE